MPDKARTKKAERRLYIVMHHGAEGWIPSIDTGNPFITFRGAQRAIKRQGPNKSLIYKIFKYVPEKIFAGRA